MMTIPFSLSILMYHSIAVNPNDPHAIAPADFAQQMEALSRQNINVVDLEEGLRRLDRWVVNPSVVITFDDALRDFLVNAAPILKHHSFPATMFVPTQFVGGSAQWDSYDKRKPLLTWDELQAIRQMGFSIGSHTISHPKLIDCTADQLQTELADSLTVLQTRLVKITAILAYPGGHYGPREMAAACQSGYVGAVGVASRLANFPWTNRFRLRRRKWSQ